MGTRWAEIDPAARVWTIPASRMKGGREHRVPLSGRSLEILETMHLSRRGEVVFSGTRSGRPLSVLALVVPLHTAETVREPRVGVQRQRRTLQRSNRARI